LDELTNAAFPDEAALTAAIAKSRSRVLMAAKVFSRLMAEFEGEIQYCQEALTEVMDAADQLDALEALQKPG
jgi:hypothetical protein